MDIISIFAPKSSLDSNVEPQRSQIVHRHLIERNDSPRIGDCPLRRLLYDQRHLDPCQVWPTAVWRLDRHLDQAEGGVLCITIGGHRGRPLADDQKSLAYRLTYQAPDRTLTDAEVARLRARIVKRLQDDLGASLRQ